MWTTSPHRICLSCSISHQVDGYTGDAGDSLTSHDGMMFSTRDNDNDLLSWQNCAERFTGKVNNKVLVVWCKISGLIRERN